jgi:hypothetical protein
MEIVKLEIMLSDEDVRRFFVRHGLKCIEIPVPVVQRSHGSATGRETCITVTDPTTGAVLDARETMLEWIRRRTVQLMLDDAERSELFMMLRDMGKVATNKILGLQ